MARHYRIGTRDITLYPIGGVASLERMPTRPSQELAIALAGPAVNVAIAGALFAGAFLAGPSSLAPVGDVIRGPFLSGLMWVNVALAAFNLLPAFPMDGGRVLRAFLAMQMPYVNATTIAARVGQGVAVLLGMLGLLTGGMLVLVAVFVFLAAQAELTMVRIRESRLHAPPVLEPFPSPRPPAFDDERVVDAEIVWLGEVQSDDDGGRSIFIVSDRPQYRR
jgi:Zn-dependent protease